MEDDLRDRALLIVVPGLLVAAGIGLPFGLADRRQISLETFAGFARSRLYEPALLASLNEVALESCLGQQFDGRWKQAE